MAVAASERRKYADLAGHVHLVSESLDWRDPHAGTTLTCMRYDIVRVVLDGIDVLKSEVDQRGY